MAKDEELTIKDELDFQYLLQLLPPLENEPEFSWLPELFSIIGARSLITLCKYCGGETIKIPTLDQLSQAIDALQWYYDVFVSKKEPIGNIPANLCALVMKIRDVYKL